jgi:hypothetical protein
LDGPFSRSKFASDPKRNFQGCRGGQELKKCDRTFSKPGDGLTKDGTLIYFARKHDRVAGVVKRKCCPNTPACKNRPL